MKVLVKKEDNEPIVYLGDRKFATIVPLDPKALIDALKVYLFKHRIRILNFGEDYIEFDDRYEYEVHIALRTIATYKESEELGINVIVRR